MLDGGLPNWKARGFPTAHGTPRIVTPAPYKAGFNPGLVRTFEQMMENFSSEKEQVHVRCVSHSQVTWCGNETH